MWIIVSFLVGAGLVACVWWLRSKDIQLTWYEWLLGILGVIALVFAFENFFGSYAEYESHSAPYFLYVFLPLGLILLAIVWQLVARRSR
jgi:hypothetical protein